MENHESGAVEKAVELAFPVTRGPLTLAFLGARQEPGGRRWDFAVRVVEGGEVVSEVQQPVDPMSLAFDDVAGLAARAAKRMEDLGSVIGIVTPAQILAPPFRRLASGEIDRAEDEVRVIGDRLRDQAHGGGFDARFDRLLGWPEEAKNTYFLALAHDVLGGEGLEAFLSQAQLEDVEGMLGALEGAGCARLASRIRQGLTLCAEEGGAEFLLQVDEGWVEANGAPVPAGEGRCWTRIDSHDEGGTWWLVEHEVAPALAEYIRAHRLALVE
jgi:hypothetical protein